MAFVSVLRLDVDAQLGDYDTATLRYKTVGLDRRRQGLDYAVEKLEKAATVVLAETTWSRIRQNGST